jgi:hypothetical protein
MPSKHDSGYVLTLAFSLLESELYVTSHIVFMSICRFQKNMISTLLITPMQELCIVARMVRSFAILSDLMRWASFESVQADEPEWKRLSLMAEVEKQLRELGIESHRTNDESWAEAAAKRASSPEAAVEWIISELEEDV